jgi:hypothetical protein
MQRLLAICLDLPNHILMKAMGGIPHCRGRRRMPCLSTVYAAPRCSKKVTNEGTNFADMKGKWKDED